MSSITIQSIGLKNTPLSDQIIEIRHRLSSDPDVPSSYTLDSDNISVNPDGTLDAPFVIDGLDADTSYVVWAIHRCSGSSVTQEFTTPPGQTVPCGEQVAYSGGESYPAEQVINLGSNQGVVTLTYDAVSIPDKFVVIFDGAEVINTGYRGDTSYQSQLDTALADRGAPPETIQSPGSGTATFNKNSATSTAILRVYAPLSGTAWNAEMSCPV